MHLSSVQGSLSLQLIWVNWQAPFEQVSVVQELLSLQDIGITLQTLLSHTP
jgi:hypothetical protein